MLSLMMVFMKRATLLLDDVLYDRAKKLSRERHATLKEVVNDLLRIALNLQPPVASKKHFKIPLHKNGPAAGVDIADRERLYDLLED